MTKKQSQNRQKTGMQKRKAPKSAFKPGKSGNPGGRPKLPPEIVELRALCRQHTREAVESIIRVMNSKKAAPGARVTAASEILDRGWGRATATVENIISGSLTTQAPDYEKMRAELRAKYGEPGSKSGA
jgi:hypothetical protein